jgi:hypothetical protein
LVTSNPSAGNATESEKALAVIRWQPVQWQALVSSGFAVARKRVLPQRQPPSIGKFHSAIVTLPLVLGTSVPSAEINVKQGEKVA